MNYRATLAHDLSRQKHRREAGVALILAIIVIFILTVLGLGLLFSTTTELQISGAETTVNKTFYSADSGVQYGILQAQLGTAQGPGCSSYANYWCFDVPEQNTGSTPDDISVRVSPLRQVDQQVATKSSIEGGAVIVGYKSYHFDSIAQSQRLNSLKQISVDVSIGPIPLN